MKILKPSRAAEKLDIKPVDLDKIITGAPVKIDNPEYEDLLTVGNIVVTDEKPGLSGYDNVYICMDKSNDFCDASDRMLMQSYNIRRFQYRKPVHFKKHFPEDEEEDTRVIACYKTDIKPEDMSTLEKFLKIYDKYKTVTDKSLTGINEKLDIKPVDLNKIKSINKLRRIPDPIYYDIIEPYRIIITNEQESECAYITVDSDEIGYFTTHGMIAIQPEPIGMHSVTHIPCDGFAAEFPLYKYVSRLHKRREILAVYETDFVCEDFNTKKKLCNIWNDLGLFDSYENIINTYK